MPTNTFFNHFDSAGEQSVMNDLIVEYIQNFGVDMIYIVRESIDDASKRNDLFGEDYIGRFRLKYPIEMYMENTDGFGGDGDLLAKFGVILRDRATFICSRSRFKEATGREIPNEGDLIYFPNTAHLFEITYVDVMNPFQQFGKTYTFKITLETFQFSEEEFDTGIHEIDRVNKERSYTLNFDLVLGGTGTFAFDEPVQVVGTDFTAIVTNFDEGTGMIKVRNPNDTEAPTSGVMIGLSSGSSWEISSGDAYTMPTQPFADNKILQDSADDIIDFGENNIFGRI